MKIVWQNMRRRLSLHLQNVRMLDRERAQEALSCYSFMNGPSQAREKELLKTLAESYSSARRFAESSDFPKALTRLGPGMCKWGTVRLPSEGSSVLVANSSLNALSLIAEAKINGYSLIIEDCPFSRRFVAPLAAREPSGLEFLSGHLLPARQSEKLQIENCKPCLFVTFCDRPMWTVGDNIETNVAGNRYHFSVIDVLLMVRAANVFVLGNELSRIPASDELSRTGDQMSGETLIRYTALCSTALSDLMADAPGRYLGMTQLVTRSAKYKTNTEKNKKGLVRSLLHYCQVSGLSIPQQSYRRLLLDLEAPRPGAKAELALT